MTKEISTDAELTNRLLTTQPTPAECLVAAARIEQLRDHLARMEGAAKALDSAASALLDTIQKSGMADNLLPALFPDAKTRGTRADAGFKAFDAARNNLRMAQKDARAALTDGGKDE